VLSGQRYSFLICLFLTIVVRWYADQVWRLTAPTMSITLRNIFAYYANRPCLGIATRCKGLTIRIGQRPVNKDGTCTEPFKWFSFSEVGEMVRNFGSGLRHIGLEPVLFMNRLNLCQVFL
jgi:hypothetical protein